jgi:hypothetical protein
MKTQTLKLLAFFIALFLANGQINAQLSCPYPIVNNLSCDVVIGYEFLDASCVKLCGPNQYTLTPGNNSIQCCQVVSDCPILILNSATFVDCDGNANNVVISFSSTGSTIN